MSPDDIVVALLLEEIGPPDMAIQRGSRLVADLHLDGDDYGMHLVPALEKRFAIKPSREEWSSVITVADLVQLVSRHLSLKPSDPGLQSNRTAR